MKRRPQATFRILNLPHIDAGALRIEVDCRFTARRASRRSLGRWWS